MKDNRTWAPLGWTPTTTSPRFQLVSQFACPDANSGCLRWGDRSSAFRRRLPSFAPVVVVVVFAVPRNASRAFPFLLAPLPDALLSVLRLFWRSFVPAGFFPGSPRSLPSLSCDASSCAAHHSSPPRPLLRSLAQRALCLACARLAHHVSSLFCLEVASRLLTPNWVFPMRQRHARSVGWRSPPA